MIEKTVFGHLPSGGASGPVYHHQQPGQPAYRCKPWAAGIVRLYMPDKSGNLGDVVLGFDDPALYTDPDLGYQGLVVGRWANRIRRPPLTFRAKPTTPP